MLSAAAIVGAYPFVLLFAGSRLRHCQLFNGFLRFRIGRELERDDETHSAGSFFLLGTRQLPAESTDAHNAQSATAFL